METKAKFLFLVIAALAGCSRVTITSGTSISADELERFFRHHAIDGNHAAALKKSTSGVASYLATIHGYPDNMAICESLIEPYNRDASMSAISGTYYCQELD